MFGNGLSTSLSTNPGWAGLVTAWNNVPARRRLLRELWGIEALHAVYGWSMGRSTNRYALSKPLPAERQVAPGP